MTDVKDSRVAGRTLLWAALAVASTAQLIVPVSMILGREATLREGKAFHFETAPVDPVDVLRGRYVRLAYAQTQVPSATGLDLERGETMYVSIQVDEDGMAQMVEASARRPESDYLKLQYRGSSSAGEESVYVRLPFDRFYMDERKAPSADIAMARLRRQEATDPSYAVVRVRDGRAVLEDVIVGGQPIVEAAEAVLEEAESEQLE
ncbi:MAG: GDYXXLXY domain-containing protein [Acidobacteriota bacterium]